MAVIGVNVRPLIRQHMKSVYVVQNGIWLPVATEQLGLANCVVV